ncbi:MAG: phosphatase PAP2 family protein, partial [Deltaproteobacteria bacterium]|nr:phosphatase PAP2 family protein [Deltaproteobacteria bacterium]
WRSFPRWRAAFICMAIATAVSVVLVKQHYIADALAGALVASAVCWLIAKK